MLTLPGLYTPAGSACCMDAGLANRLPQLHSCIIFGIKAESDSSTICGLYTRMQFSKDELLRSTTHVYKAYIYKEIHNTCTGEPEIEEEDHGVNEL